MAQTLVQIFIHVVFSTKNRVEMITPEIEPELFAYIGGIAANNNSKLVAATGTANHIHLLILLSKTIGTSELVGDIKRNSSRWIKTKGDNFKSFGWQDGFGAFSIGQTQVSMVKEYIANQKEKHRRQTFEAVRRGMIARRILEGVVKNKYRANVGKLAAWLSASHIERAPKPTPKP